jgi:WD40 repeat protein
VSPDGAWVATAGADETIRVWDLPDGTLGTTIRSIDSQYGVAALPGGSRLVTVDGLGSVAFWDVAADNAGTPYRPRTEAIRACGNRGWACTTAPDGSWVAAVGEQLVVLDPATATVLRTDRDIGGRAVRALSSERVVASLGGVVRPAGAPREEVILQVLDARTGERLFSMKAAAGVVVNDVATAPSGDLVAAACEDWTVRVWQIGGGAPVALLRVKVGAGLERDLRRLALSFTGTGERTGLTGCRFLDDDHVVTTGFDGSVRLWDLAGTAAPAVAFLPHPVLAVDVWPPSRLIVCGDAVGGLHRLVAESP